MPLAPTVNGINLDRSTVDRQNSFLLSADVSDADYVVAEINEKVFQLEIGPASGSGYIYRRRIHAVEIGQFTGTGYVVGYKKSTNESGYDTFSITVSELSPIEPEEFYKAMLQSGLSYTTLRDVNIDIESDVARVDKQNGTGVIIRPMGHARKNVAKHQYKDIDYILHIEVYSSESRKRCRELFEAVLAVEEANVNIDGSDVYEMLEIMDDSKWVPSWNTFMVKHTVKLKKYLQKVQIPGY